MEYIRAFTQWTMKAPWLGSGLGLANGSQPDGRGTRRRTKNFGQPGLDKKSFDRKSWRNVWEASSGRDPVFQCLSIPIHFFIADLSALQSVGRWPSGRLNCETSMQRIVINGPERSYEKKQKAIKV